MFPAKSIGSRSLVSCENPSPADAIRRFTSDRRIFNRNTSREGACQINLDWVCLTRSLGVFLVRTYDPAPTNF